MTDAPKLTAKMDPETAARLEQDRREAWQRQAYGTTEKELKKALAEALQAPVLVGHRQGAEAILWLAISNLSDAQELEAMGRSNRQLLNVVKWMLMEATSEARKAAVSVEVKS